MNDLDWTTLRKALPSWVPELRCLEVTDSTNRQALAWAEAGAPHGALVVADFQTAGRGRLERPWLAPAGSSLLFSVVLRPYWRDKQLLPLAAAVAVCECLGDLGIQAGVKWPNDVLLGERKACGILAEAAGDRVVLGVGLNVGQSSFPDDLQYPATSLELHTGRNFGRAQLLARLIRRLAVRVDGPAEAVPGLYRPWCRTLGRRVSVSLESGTLEDRAVDIDSSGALLLAGGASVQAGDVRHLR